MLSTFSASFNKCFTILGIKQGGNNINKEWQWSQSTNLGRVKRD